MKHGWKPGVLTEVACFFGIRRDLLMLKSYADAGGFFMHLKAGVKQDKEAGCQRWGKKVYQPDKYEAAGGKERAL